MGLELPAFLCPLLAEVGATWPDSDEAKIFEIAEAFRKCGIDMGYYNMRTRNFNEPLPWLVTSPNR